jgi:uncharacterized protein YjbI with pentapeptide repeats
MAQLVKASLAKAIPTGALSSENSTSVSGNIGLIQSQINLKTNDYINIKNAVKILETYSNWNGYIKLYTEVESNFRLGDTVYITYTEPSVPTDTFNLENPATPFTNFYLGYKILYINSFRNEVVINRYFNDIPAGKKLKNQYLSKISVRGGNLVSGTLDGVVLYDCDIHSGVTFTQGVIKYCNISAITFDDKYSNIKTIKTTDNFNSKFSSSAQPSLATTSTSLSKNNYYYNRIESCTMWDCNVKNGKFINCIFIGSGTGLNNFINDGYFSGCTFTGYKIYNGKFYNCRIDANNLWENGYWDNINGTDDFLAAWHNGTWNRGHFSSSYNWQNGVFNSGVFHQPAIWYNGVANGGTFSGITWYHGLVRNANFITSDFENGVINNGVIFNCNLKGGTFNNGKIYNSVISGMTIYNGSITGGTITSTETEIRGGTFSKVNIVDGKFYNLNGRLLNISNGDFYGGTYSNCIFNGGDIYNGTYYNISGTTNLLIHNGSFNKSRFTNIRVHNGNFTSCVSQGTTLDYGVYTEGYFLNGIWNDGYWNDGFMSGTTWYNGQFYGGYFWCPTPVTNYFRGGTFHYGYLNGVYYTQLPRPRKFLENQAAPTGGGTSV